MTALSIVVPCYNEQDCLPELHRRLSAAAHAVVGEDYELVLVNDGSGDRTWPIMRDLAGSDRHVVAVNLSRNHGHQLALTAGLDICRGARILTGRPPSSARRRTASIACCPARPKSTSRSTPAISA